MPTVASTRQGFNAPQRSLQSKIVGALIWLPLKLGNAWISTQVGGQKRPVFFSVEETFPELLELEQNFDVIRQELEGILPERDGVPSYHELDPMQARISGSNNPDARWKVFLLYAMGEKPAENRERCPRTSELLDKVPNVTQAFFSILEGGKSVPAHCGPYRGFLRYHLALKVPKQDIPRMRVKDQWVSWREGEGFLFDDTWEHEVINNSQQIRVVLLVDVQRPLRRVLGLVNRGIFWVLRYVYARKMIRKL